MPFALSQHSASPAPLSASVQAGPVSFFRQVAMPKFKRQFILFSVASAGYGIAFFGSLLMKDPAIHLLVRLIGFSGFGVSALLVYKKHRSAKLAA